MPKSSLQKNSIWIAGPCIVNDELVTHENTLVGLIADWCEKRYPRVYAVNRIDLHDLDSWNSFEMKENDILIYINTDPLGGSGSVSDEMWHMGKTHCDMDMTDVYDKRPAGERWFTNAPIHALKPAHRAITKKICEEYLADIIPKMNFDKEQKIIVEGDPFYRWNNEIEKYFVRIHEHLFQHTDGKTGAIVMNGNPFTYGHQYLIEQALKQVDHLYIFVVEEDKSLIDFETRFRLVLDGLHNLGGGGG